MNTSAPTHAPASSGRREEFDPVAVFNVIWRRKGLFLLVLSAVLLAGFAVALFNVPSASYVTVLQIGSAYGNNSLSGKLVEDTDGVVTKLERSVIPEVSRTWGASRPAEPVPMVTVKGKKNAGVILLMTREKVDRQADVSAFHKAIAGRIVETHRMLVMKQYESFMSQARKDLVKSRAQLKQLAAALSEQQQRRTLLEEQLKRLNNQIESISVVRKEFVDLAGDRNARPELYLVQLDLPAMLERRDSLEEELNISLDLEIADIRQEISNAESDRDTAEKYIELLEDERDRLRLTRIQSLASPMPTRIGFSPALILFVSLVLGILAAWFAVVFAEYVARRHVQG